MERRANCSISPEHSEQHWGKKRIYVGSGSPTEDADEAEHTLCREGTLLAQSVG